MVNTNALMTTSRLLAKKGSPIASDQMAGAVDEILELRHKNEVLSKCIADLIEEPRRSTKLINKKIKATEPMQATFLKGQVLHAIGLTSGNT